MARARISRPRKMVCGCGGLVFLGSCGVEAHRQPKPTRRAQMEECNGFVYIHVENGGIACPDPQAR